MNTLVSFFPRVMLLCAAMVFGTSAAQSKAPTSHSVKPAAASAPSDDDDTRTTLLRHLQQAHTALEQNQRDQLVVELESALELARERAPLQLKALTVVSEVPQGLGMYLPAPGGRISANTLLLYVEVRHFQSRRIQGQFEIHLSTDASFFYDDGELISSKKGIGTHRFVSRTQQDVTFMVIELRTQGLPAQPYQVQITVTDHVSGKSASARVPFVVRP